jgi:hypothetical protein
MKKSKKLRIERIVNARIGLLQEEQLNEQGWWNTVKSVAKYANDMTPHMIAYNSTNDLYNTAKDISGGKNLGQAAMDYGNTTLDRTQQSLDAAGMVPGYGIFADAGNVATSATRAGLANLMGDKENELKHQKNAALSAAAMIPGAGLAAGGAKIAGRAIKPALKTAKYASKAGKTGYKGSTAKQAGTGGMATDAYNMIKNWF